MNDDQAADVVQYLIGAAHVLDEARAATRLLPDEDKDAASLRELIIKLNLELLTTLFQRFPHSLPFREFPEINSSLRWEDVLLPPTVSEKDVDQIIFSIVTSRWQKMAAVVWLTVNRGEELGFRVTDEMFAARVQALVEEGPLKSQGDLRKWRHSEVRLKRQTGRPSKLDA
jgi:hypothetical protein